MSVLYLALAIYIVGIAIVLYLRPSVMFHPDNGTWKEFGLDTGRNSTVFPFWMFTIVWAFLSYAIASIGNVFVANVVLQSTSPEEHIATPISEIRYTEAMPGSQVVHTENTMVPVSRPRAPSGVRMPRMPRAAPPQPMPMPMPMPMPDAAVAAPTQLPGYYIVEPQASGVPKFIYFGHEPPSFENLTPRS
jgi:hypothetical protein